MTTDDALIDRLAELSRLEFDEAARVTLRTDMQKIFDMVDKLKEVNVDGIEPLIYLSDDHTVLREDIVSGQVSKEDALSNAPQKDSDFFKVPKVIKK
jgi:aspartyl-tRNA(Asn)/glutamyl-tRNA(Gln) amidotransferase subunit C